MRCGRLGRLRLKLLNDYSGLRKLRLHCSPHRHLLLRCPLVCCCELRHYVLAAPLAQSLALRLWACLHRCIRRWRARRGGCLRVH